ncbi:MAG: formylglycine-generating enzyme family protein [Pyrinomonadaceae bacterium]
MKDEVEVHSSEGMVYLPGGEFLMGSDDGMPHEGPVHRVTLKPFWIDETEVTVAQFEGFVKSTEYKTEAERFGWSGVFDMRTGEWTRVDGADWSDPEGNEQKPDRQEPVTQISWADANAFAAWAGKRLPTEAEWEYASRGGLVQKKYAWGDELNPGGKPTANWWQGHFPDKNTGEDGFPGRAPVRSFPPNNDGLYDMIGNVWEWTSDWFAHDYYGNSPARDPQGARDGTERVIRGGSWMCSENFCSNYRPSARSASTPDTGLNNLGFRCARDQRPAGH